MFEFLKKNTNRQSNSVDDAVKKCLDSIEKTQELVGECVDEAKKTSEEKSKPIEKPGLRDYFVVDELLPLKGLQFRIKVVSFDEIMLKYDGVTHKTAKRLEERKKK